MKKTTSFMVFGLTFILLLSACETEKPSPEAAEVSTPATAASDTPSPTDEEQSYAGKVPAPEFPAGLDWLNTDEPLRLADLRGKVVLLDFWTYGCINCIHIIPDLKRLEEKYADELVVIGVHSAKFENEGETENIRQVILRYELEHPVINDNEFAVWGQYGAQAWPTLVLIDPEGRVLGYHSGEGVYDPFDTVIEGMVAEFDALGRIDRTPLNLKLERENLVNSPLLFPGKVLADVASNRLFIADSNHNRIVVTDLAGTVLEVIGDGQARLEDGSYETAGFFRPQGLTLADENTLYVADTENHSLRRVDLVTRQVTTVAGDGRQVYMQGTSSPAAGTSLNSPWDVLYHDGLVYIAMAGQHQLWAYDLATDTIRLHAGTGREELADGPQLREGGLNQPSGLGTDGQVLYFADSEASAIRIADFDSAGELQTIVGTGLFDFGDVDGRAGEVRLQHPLGVVFHDGLLYVADTYNSKIKTIDPETRESITYLGGPESGWRDGGEPLFDEPGGLSIDGDMLYIADTNNHVIRVVDLETKETSTLVLLDVNGLLTRPVANTYSGQIVTLAPQSLAPGESSVTLSVTLPDGYKLNDLAPFSMSWTADGAVDLDVQEANQRLVAPSFPLSFGAKFEEGKGELTGDLVIYYCEAVAQSLCFIEQVRLILPVTVEPGGDTTLEVEHVIEVPPGL